MLTHAIHLSLRSDPNRDDEAQTIAETTPPIAADEFQGGTQAIVFDGGWLALIHEVSERNKRRYYQHRFVWFDFGKPAAAGEPPVFLNQEGGRIRCRSGPGS